jgi:hypothetical protein
MTARVSMLLKSRASPDMLPFSLCNKKRLFPTPISNDTIDSVLRHREVGRAKDLPAPLVRCMNLYLVSVGPEMVIGGADGDVVAQSSGLVSVNKLIHCHYITKRCNSTMQGLPCNVHIYLAGREIPTFHATRRVIIVFTKVPHPESFLSSRNLPIRYILVLFHLLLGIPTSQAKIM